MRISRVILFVKDFEPMVVFYRECLGLSLVEGAETPGWAELEAGGLRLALHAIPGEVAQRIALETPARAREETPIKLVFVASDVAAERNRLVSLGVRISEMKPWGGCDGIDPEGNVFQIAPT